MSAQALTEAINAAACMVGITPFNFPAMVPAWMFPVALGLRQYLRPEAARTGAVRIVTCGGGTQLLEAIRRTACLTLFTVAMRRLAC